jgi:hypothetical protein
MPFHTLLLELFHKTQASIANKPVGFLSKELQISCIDPCMLLQGWSQGTIYCSKPAACRACVLNSHLNNTC